MLSAPDFGLSLLSFPRVIAGALSGQFRVEKSFQGLRRDFFTWKNRFEDSGRTFSRGKIISRTPAGLFHVEESFQGLRRDFFTWKNRFKDSGRTFSRGRIVSRSPAGLFHVEESFRGLRRGFFALGPNLQFQISDLRSNCRNGVFLLFPGKSFGGMPKSSLK